jgi:hypothetical protein
MAQVSDFTGLLSGTSVTGRINQPTFLTYSFPTSVPAYLASVFTAAGLATFQEFSAAYKSVARAAINSYADVSGLTVFEAAPGQGDVQFMMFDTALLNNPSSGFGYYPANGGYSSQISSDVFIDLAATSNGTNLYLLMHELGHTLGLKHAFDGTTTLAPDVDDAAHSVLSSRYINGFTGKLGSFDVEAVQHLYGGANRDGTQVASYSWDAANSILTQHALPGSGFVNGVAARDVLIGGVGQDTLIGGAGDDTLRGDAGEDRLVGGPGADVIVFEPGSGIDQVADFSAAEGDRVDLRAFSSMKTFADVLSLIGASGSATILQIGSDVLILNAARSSLTAEQFIFAPFLQAVRSDLNADGASDILWRNANGAMATWQFGSGGTQAQGAFNAAVDPNWRIVETGDFNGDGLSDILWRHAGGTMSVWNALGGGTIAQGGYTDASVGTEWRIAGVGDLNGDGKDDLLWQNQNGAVSSWNATGGGFQQNSYYHASVGGSWTVVGLADFNGDGKADLLWRDGGGGISTWLSNANGISDGGFFTNVPSSWHVDGLGDFDGDGRADVLWRNDTGALSVWRSNGAGFDQGVYNTQVDTGWRIETVGDYNGDGRADILWRHSGGALSTWQSNGNGFDQGVYNNNVDPSWDIIGHDFPL